MDHQFWSCHIEWKNKNGSLDTTIINYYMTKLQAFFLDRNLYSTVVWLCLWRHFTLHPHIQPPCVTVWTSEWRFWYQRQLRRLPSTHSVPVRLWEWVTPMKTTLHPLQLPTSLQISPRLSLQPLTSWKNNPGITSRPHWGPCQAFAFIVVWKGGKERRGLEGGGVWRGSMPHKGRSGREY